ncbi:MAG: hypothetical protein KDK36_05440 [Leptospiraceae bacterium]|nr:hypothetical protein [Leptospiraceae bacterium]
MFDLDLQSIPGLVEKFHFHILKVNVLKNETKIFLERCPENFQNLNYEIAIQNRWFGNKSDARIKHLFQVFNSRYLAYPKPISLLKKNIHKMNQLDWNWIIYIHLLVTDPVFRWFSCDYLFSLSLGEEFSRDELARNMEEVLKDHIRTNTRITLSAKLITAGKFLGILKGGSYFKYSPLDFSHFGLYYVLYFLQTLSFDINLFPKTNLFRGFYPKKDRFTIDLEELSGNKYIHLHWYGDEPSIQLSFEKEVL